MTHEFSFILVQILIHLAPVFQATQDRIDAVFISTAKMCRQQWVYISRLPVSNMDRL